MYTNRRFWLVALSLALGLPVLAADEPGEVAPDVPARVEKDLFHPPVRLTAADGVIDHGEAWGHCGPCLADVDGDGRTDLVVGDFRGLFHFYRNTGTNHQPRYDKAVKLKAGRADAQVPIG
jgi:hypothetical protein